MAKKTSTAKTTATTPTTKPTPSTQTEVVVPDVALTYAVKTDFTPGRGFATEVYKVVKETPSTAQRVVDAMLASGAYQKVAPRAAELRPLRPVTVILKQWVAQGVVEVR